MRDTVVATCAAVRGVARRSLVVVVAAQALVYRKSRRFFVEHAVLILHTTAFAMLLTPVEVVIQRVLQGRGLYAESSTFVMAPVVAMYWLLALRDVFKDSLPLTLLKAASITMLAFSLVLVVIFVVYASMG